MTDSVDAKNDARQPSSRVGILVLGMHRSGTSAMTGLLHYLGCDLPAHLLPGAAGNELGHWESETAMILNDQILASAGSCWNDWSPVNSDWYKSPFHGSFLQAAREALRTEFAASPLFVLKDPRICRLAPIWLEALDLEDVAARLVIPVRNPLEVSASLQARDGIESAYGQLLWLRHILDAEYFSRGRRRIFCTYNQLLDDRPALINSLQEKFDLTWPRYTAASRANIAKFLSNKNRHHEEKEEAVLADPALSRWLRESYAILLRWSEGDENEEDYATLDSIRHEFDAASDAFAPLLIPGHRLNVGEPERTRLQEELTVAKSRIDAAEAAARDAQAELEASRTAGEAVGLEANHNLELAHRALEASQRETAELAHRLATAESTLQQRLEEIDQTAQALALANQEANARSSEAERLRNRLVDADAWVYRLSGDRRAAEMATEAAKRDLAAAQVSMRAAEEARDGLQARLSRMEDKLERLRSARSDPETAEHGAAFQNLAEEVKAQNAANERLIHELAATKEKATTSSAALDDRFRELTMVTRLLRSSEAQREKDSSDVEWLRQTNAVLMTSPRWWSFLPRSWSRKRELRRLRSRGLFDAEHYLALHPDVVAEGMDPLRHYILHGMAEGRER